MIMSRLTGSTQAERDEIRQVVKFTLEHPLDLYVYDKHPNFNTEKYELPLFCVPQGKPNKYGTYRHVYLTRDITTKKLVKVKPEDWVKTPPRAYTKDEMRALFLKRLWSNVQYWEKESRAVTARDKLSGLVHSILALMDGSTCDMCGFELYPHVSPSDRSYHIQNGENYFLTSIEIGGSLAAEFHRHDPQKTGKP